jgi:hypothetical protein
MRKYQGKKKVDEYKKIRKMLGCSKLKKNKEYFYVEQSYHLKFVGLHSR